MVVDDTKINYIQYGNKKGHNIVLLHGWGQNIEMMKPLGDAMAKSFHITIIDLPGFGYSDEPKQALNTEGYADTVKKLLDKLNINNPILCGHSFGGRISIIYASKYHVKKLILLGTPYRKSNKKDSLKVKILKLGKKVINNEKFESWTKQRLGSIDYRNASDMMKKVLVETVNMDLTEYAKKIPCETLLIWGSDDTAAPISEGKGLENIIKNAGLVVFNHFGHYAYLENLYVTIRVLDKFLEKESTGE